MAVTSVYAGELSGPERRCRDSVLLGPSQPQPLPEGAQVDAVALRGVVKQDPLSVHRKPHVTSMVSALFGARRPIAIVLAVWTIVRSTLDGVLGAGPWSHVTHERHVVASPLWRHRDTPTAVVLVVRILWVMAALLRRLPDSIFRAAVVAVSRHRLPHALITQASAALILPAGQTINAYGAFNTALTATVEILLTPWMIGDTDDCPSRELVPREIQRRRHPIIISQGAF